MRIEVSPNPQQLGTNAAALAVDVIQSAIQQRGRARIVLSTGASQFETLTALVQGGVDWSKVEVFHLDEYVGISADHPASFRRYLRERFEQHAKGVTMHYVNTEGNITATIASLTTELRRVSVDLALIGIGENAHVAFNDPPADFTTNAAYIVVNLDDACKSQQVGEGWFTTRNEVPNQAVTMTVHQILQSKVIISAVPYTVKANAIQQTLTHSITNQIPATILKSHPHWHLFLDEDSAAGVFPR